MSNVVVESFTQRIVMNAATQSVSVINAGPMGPAGSAGTDAHIADVAIDAMQEGSGISLDKTTVPGQVTIINTGAVSSYTSENARDDIAAAARGTADRIVVTNDDVGNTITWDLDPVLLQRIVNLEQTKSLIQYKDTTGGVSGVAYMNLNGSAGWVSTPSNAAYDFTGDITVIAKVKMPSTATSFNLVSRWSTTGSVNTGGQFRWSVQSTGQMTLVITTDGATQDTLTTTAATPLAFDGNWIWLRFTRQALASDVDFYKAADDGTNTPPASWTSFQANRAINTGNLYGGSAAPLTIGSYNAGAGNPFTGQIARAVVYNGNSTASTIVADVNASDWTTGTTWASGTPSRTWTLNGTATVTPASTSGMSNTATEGTLTETDAFTGIAVKRGDTLFWSAVGTFTNTSTAAVNFTPKFQVNGVDLFTMAAISIPNVAAQFYRWEAVLKIEVNAIDGTTQIAEGSFTVWASTAGDDSGSISLTAPISGGQVGGSRKGTITTFLSIPAIRMRLTMAYVSVNTVAAKATLTQLFLGAA